MLFGFVQSHVFEKTLLWSQRNEHFMWPFR